MEGRGDDTAHGGEKLKIAPILRGQREWPKFDLRFNRNCSGLYEWQEVGRDSMQDRDHAIEALAELIHTPSEWTELFNMQQILAEAIKAFSRWCHRSAD
jgi:hypothetical protein